MTASLYLLILILILLSTLSWCFFSSTPLAILSLLLSTSFPFIFSKLKQRKKNGIKAAAFAAGFRSDELSSGDPNLVGSPNGSVSEDEESLIEIALPEGHYMGCEKKRKSFEHEILSDYLPESLFLQHGLMELLTEINEEDNLIEIDIAVGSIKCPQFELS